MGKIVGVKSLVNQKMKYNILLNMEETLRLKGRLRDVHFFSTDSATVKSGLMETGMSNATKYFTIPEEFIFRKSKKKIKQEPLTSCLKMETQGEVFFIYIMQKGKSP